jgi:hypothetical protein
MNGRNFLGILFIFFLTWSFGCTRKLANSSSPTAVSPTSAHEDPDEYYTCSMHHQIHLHEPGKCPICGMPLVQVTGNAQNKNLNEKESVGLEISDTQKKNANISIYTVSKKDLVISIPVAGRSLSSKEIAFQLYESDLTYVKPSSLFSGTLTSQADKTLKGHIVSIDRLIDPSSRTVRAVGILDQSVNMIAESGFQGKITSLLKNQTSIPCPSDQHWDIPMAMCMPGKTSK